MEPTTTDATIAVAAAVFDGGGVTDEGWSALAARAGIAPNTMREHGKKAEKLGLIAAEPRLGAAPLRRVAGLRPPSEAPFQVGCRHGGAPLPGRRRSPRRPGRRHPPTRARPHAMRTHPVIWMKSSSSSIRGQSSSLLLLLSRGSSR
jgi:hypothetical protein